MRTYAHIFPEAAMRISNADDLGRFVRERRRVSGMTQTDLATRAQVSRRWLSDLESGKATAEVGLVFRVTAALGLWVDVEPAPPPEIDLDAYLDQFGGNS